MALSASQSDVQPPSIRLLTPSQAVTSRNNNTITHTNNNQSQQRRQRQQRMNQPQPSTTNNTNASIMDNEPPNNNNQANNNTSNSSDAKQQQQQQQQRSTSRRGNQNSRRKKTPKKNQQDQQRQKNNEQGEEGVTTTPAVGTRNNNNSTKKKTKTRQRKRKPLGHKKKHAWWRKQLPDRDAVDPITLDPLIDLRYPPFALVGDGEPFEPVNWPPMLSTKQQEQRAVLNKKKAAAAALASAVSSSSSSDEEERPRQKISEEERQRRILQEQWGTTVVVPIGEGSGTEGDNGSATSKPQATTESSSSPGDGGKGQQQTGAQQLQNTGTGSRATARKRHVNLYDGRALAYYMVSQLQFIDPLNRRDLTRNELVHLDQYLRRHGFNDLNVTEAYDARGITLSTAGAAATTAAGRAAMLQEEAQNLLRALFAGHATATTPTTPNTNTNTLMAQYQAHEQAQQQQDHYPSPYRMTNPRQHNDNNDHDDIGIYGDSAGLVVIDDDINPGLRSNAPEFVPTSSDATTPGTNTTETLYSARHIAQQYGGGYHAARIRENDFPTLATTTTAPSPAAAAAVQQQQNETTSTNNNNNKTQKNLPKAKTLSKIGSMVKKTDPEELQKQWEAREEARRKAILSNLTFGSNPVAAMSSASEIPTQITTTSTDAQKGGGGPTEAQLERNRALADALGVQPATMRQTSADSMLRSGWARSLSNTDEFGNELAATMYPESLISRAREMRRDHLLKLERKWKTFLSDDTAASLPLNSMDRPMRAFVHEYADYWKLHAESFDPEPKRYIHCVKLRDTSAPCPLLSDIVSRPPGAVITMAMMVPGRKTEHPQQQTAGQTTGSPPTPLLRELPPPPTRVPLPLKPRSAVVVELPSSSSATTTGVSISGARTMESSSAVAENSRFAALLERERPKLQLQKRTLPLENPPLSAEQQQQQQQNASSFDVAQELERQKEREQAKARKEKEAEERKQRALEAAFASDDDRPVGKGGGVFVESDDDSSWEEQEAAYTEESGEEDQAS